MAFSPDGARIVTASTDGTVRVWDPDGHEVAVLRGHTGAVTTVAFSRDRERIISVAGDGIRVWDSVPYRIRCAEHKK